MIAPVRRRYACPDPCIYNCAIETTSQYVQDPIKCPCGRGWLYGWLLLETAGGEQ